jgi:hypothetical protein
VYKNFRGIIELLDKTLISQHRAIFKTSREEIGKSIVIYTFNRLILIPFSATTIFSINNRSFVKKDNISE